ncbi:MAG: heavy-metal-associated domain-containing protein [Chloroflexi bacterium]|nr:heavy-metal-associated domain-containing protein [Chloroflexota bacterium]
MRTKSFDVPAMYGDHHVSDVRRILLEIPGVKDVYASSAFHVVEVVFDENVTTDSSIQAKLDAAGYLGDFVFQAEAGKAVGTDGGGTFMRHTAVYEQTRKVIGFSQQVAYRGRPLWPCPGMGPIKSIAEEK